MPAERFDFPNAAGQKLAALLDCPPGEPRAYALFAHCFTCGKDVHAAKRIAEGLTALDIAVLRFDFTGLWPIRIAGARRVRRSSFAAATRSATLDENVVLANSPSLEPSPVKSKRRTAISSAVSPSAIRLAACTSLPQVKQ